VKIGATWMFSDKPENGTAAFQTARVLSAKLVADYPNDKQFEELLAGIENALRPTANTDK